MIFMIYLLQDRAPLKVLTHGSKLMKFSIMSMPNEFRAIIVDISMLSLLDCSLTVLDTPLLSAFVEQWHKEKFVLHLFFDEMIIILNDVSILFHSLLLITFSPISC